MRWEKTGGRACSAPTYGMKFKRGGRALLKMDGEDGAQRKGLKIVKGLSHEILNTVKMDGEDRARSAKAQKL